MGSIVGMWFANHESLIPTLPVLHPDVFWAHRFLEVKDWVV